MSAPERLVALALGVHADKQGRCYPSQARLANETGLSERAVRDALRGIEASASPVRVTHRSKPGPSRVSGRPPNEYSLELVIPATAAAKTTRAKAATAAANPERMPAGDAANSHTGFPASSAIVNGKFGGEFPAPAAGELLRELPNNCPEEKNALEAIEAELRAHEVFRLLNIPQKARALEQQFQTMSVRGTQLPWVITSLREYAYKNAGAGLTSAEISRGVSGFVHNSKAPRGQQANAIQVSPPGEYEEYEAERAALRQRERQVGR